MAIQNFADHVTQTFFENGKFSKKVGWRNVKKVVLRKLDILNYAYTLDDLRSPPGNRLEALKGSLRGLYSIRVNDQWRIVFAWSEYGPEKVRVIDYHS